MTILALDQGTSSSRAILFDDHLRPLHSAARPVTQSYPRPGEVEHNPRELLDGILSSAREVLARVTRGSVAAIGLTNQRETTLLWDRATGEALHPAIVWQDRRTAAACEAVQKAGHEDLIRTRSGLLPDPYFSASKLSWLLDHLPGARARAEAGELCFGTVDSWLIWHLTGGRLHVTDATNAARTALFNIHTQDWDAELCALWRIPMGLLPQVRDSAGDFGVTDPGVLGQALPIRGVAGDQQAAAMGQGCFAPGQVKSTYGTGCFVLLNTGSQAVQSRHRLLTTVASRLKGEVSYALEGAIFVAGAAVQWLRDGPGLIARPDELEALAALADPADGTLLVPAFSGLGAPWWSPDSRGALLGLSARSGRAEIARAVLQSAGYQTRDLIGAMQADWQGSAGMVLRVDGGMANSDAVVQFIADILGAPVDRPDVTEATARGAAWLAAWASDLAPGPQEFARTWAAERRFTPQMSQETREAHYARWQRAVAATLAF